MKKIILILCVVLAFASCGKQGLNINNFIEVNPSTELLFETEPSSAVLTISSSGKWIIREVPDWITVTPSEGGDGELATVSVVENQSEHDRIGTFKFICGSASATVSVTQYGKIKSDYVDLKFEDPRTSINYDNNTGKIVVSYDGITPPTVRKGQAVVLGAEYGYDIRVVENVSKSGSTFTLQTSEGNMSDLFKNTSFTLTTSGTTGVKSNGRRIITPSEIGYFDTDGSYYRTYIRNADTKSADFQNGGKLWSFEKDFNGTTIAEGKAGRLYWENCSFNAGLNGEFTFDFGEKKIDEVRTKGDIKLFRYILNGKLDMDFLLHYQYTASYSEENDEIIAKNVIKTISFKFLVGNVPVYITVDTHIGKSTEFSAEGEINATAGVMLGAEVDMGVEWTKETGARAIKSVTPNLELHHPTFQTNASAEAKISYYPHIDIRLYNFLGPWVEPRPYIKESVGAGLRASTDGNNYIGWQAGTYTGMDLKLGLDLDFGIWEFTPWESEMFNPIKDQLLFEAPSKITAIFPQDKTQVKFGETITAEFIVESYSPLTDKYYPCPLALINFDTDGGKLKNTVVVADMYGKAYTEWYDIYLPQDESILESIAFGNTLLQTRSSDANNSTHTLTARIINSKGSVIDDTAITVELEGPTSGQWVDLGLPSGIKWAAWNVGATSPEEYGGYYAWGETKEKNDYSFDTYEHREPDSYNEDGTVSNWCYKDIGYCISGTKYDVATVKWGGGARMPIEDELWELSSCSHIVYNFNGIEGCLVIGPNGNSIFFPFAGFKGNPDDLHGQCVGPQALIWSGTMVEHKAHGAISEMFCHEHVYHRHTIFFNRQYMGLTVRPVKD